MLSNWLPLIKQFLEGAAKLLLGLFVYNQGKKSVELDNAKEVIEDVKETQKINAGVESLSDKQLDDILLDDRKE